MLRQNNGGGKGRSVGGGGMWQVNVDWSICPIEARTR
jgi:hypothetical protein